MEPSTIKYQERGQQEKPASINHHYEYYKKSTKTDGRFDLRFP